MTLPRHAGLLAAGLALFVAGWCAKPTPAPKDRPTPKTVERQLRDWPAEVARVQRVNDSLLTLIARRRSAATGEHQRRDSILAEHPVALAPAACNPWVEALSNCAREADSLRSALELADSVHQRDSLTLERSKTVASQGATLLKERREPRLMLFGEANYAVAPDRKALLDGDLTVRGGVALRLKPLTYAELSREQPVFGGHGATIKLAVRRYVRLF